MKASTLVNQLNKGLSLTQGNKVIPITSCFKFDGVDTFSATDENTYINIKVGDIGVNNSFCVNGNDFVNILKALGDSEIQLTTADNTITIKSGRSKYKLPIEKADTFLSIKGEFSEPLSVDANELKHIIKATSYAVHNDNLRPAMCGIYFNGNQVVATNISVMPVIDSSLNLNFIMPISLAKMINQNIIGNCDISFSNSHIKVVGEGNEVYSRMIEEKFPDYKAVIPKSATKSLSIESKELASVVSRLLLTSNRNTGIVVLDLGSELKAYSSDVDFNKEGFEELDGKYTGEPLKIGFNGRFLIDSLRSVDDEIVTIEFTEDVRPGVIVCSDRKILVMPMRIQN